MHYIEQIWTLIYVVAAAAAVTQVDFIHRKGKVKRDIKLENVRSIL